MPNINRLTQNYQNYVQLQWQPNLSVYESIWFAVYPPEKERALLQRLDAFEVATLEAGKAWRSIDLRGAYTKWLNQEDDDERTEMFTTPKDLEFFAKEDFPEFLAEYISQHFTEVESPNNTVFAVYGLMEIYDYTEVSAVIELLENSLVGRLLVFFPGSKEDNTYRFMNARKGWDYLAVCIDSSQDLFS